MELTRSHLAASRSGAYKLASRPTREQLSPASRGDQLPATEEIKKKQRPAGDAMDAEMGDSSYWEETQRYLEYEELRYVR
jgi:hypothetical protein